MAVLAYQQTKPEARPMINAPCGPTTPDAGVIAAKPAIEPVTIPSTVGFPFFIHSINIHVNAAVAAEICVTTIAVAPPPSAAKPLPPLKPNQPTQSIPVPATVIGRLCGII